MPTLTNGLVVMTPTSTAKTGTGSTATINSNGSVTFAACTTLSLNGVFTSSYDNYMVAIRNTGNQGSSDNIVLRLRASGTDATGSNYTWQWMQADGTTVNGTRTSSTDKTRVGIYGETTKYGGSTFYVFGPNLSQPTAFRSVNGHAYLNAYLIDYASTHSLSTSYDGFTLFPETSGTFGGLITVFGFNQ